MGPAKGEVVAALYTEDAERWDPAIDTEGWPATGGAFVLEGVTIVQLDGDLIPSEHAYWDKETLFNA